MGVTEEQKEKDTDRRTMSYMELMRGHLSYIGQATTYVGAPRVRQAFVLLLFFYLLSTVEHFLVEALWRGAIMLRCGPW